MDEHSTAEQASADAIHKAKNAQQAIEAARAAQVEEAAMKAAERTKAALLDGLRQVFTNDNDKSPQEMRVLIQRVPIICTNIMQMHDDIKALKDTQVWVARLVIGAVILGLLKFIFLS